MVATIVSPIARDVAMMKAATMPETAAMTNAAGGTDQVKAGAPFQVLFFVGLLLFLVTLVLNLVGDRFVQRVRQKY
jgi:ABC-type phosphate transport system permease subunit